jgi:hypothetical protein
MLFGWTQKRKKCSSANASSYLDFLIVQQSMKKNSLICISKRLFGSAAIFDLYPLYL